MSVLIHKVFYFITKHGWGLVFSLMLQDVYILPLILPLGRQSLKYSYHPTLYGKLLLTPDASSLDYIFVCGDVEVPLKKLRSKLKKRSAVSSAGGGLPSGVANRVSLFLSPSLYPLPLPSTLQSKVVMGRAQLTNLGTVRTQKII